RGLYTFWQRTFLDPSLLAFDAPSREEITCTRTVSNTPMQALTLMNDPVFVEASRVFAERIVTRASSRYGKLIVTASGSHFFGTAFSDGLNAAFELALSRKPAPTEATVLKNLYVRELARYHADPAAARQAISEGDWPVCTSVDPAELA